MRYVKLEEICFKGVSSLRQKDTLPVGDYPVYGASGICGYLSGCQHNEPYVAVVKDGAGVGRVQLCSGKSSVLGTLQALLPKDEVSCEYLYEVVRSLELGAGFTGSTIPHIYFKDYKNRTVVIYEKEQQTKITTLFTTLKNVVELHKCAISFYDELVKSRFVEMFGDIDNTQYEVVTIQDLCEPIKDGTHKTPTYAHGPEDGVMFLSSKDVTTGKIDWNNTKYITPTLHEELKKRVSPRKGDVLLAKNGTTGICAVVDRDEVFDLYVTLALLRPLAGVDSYYLWAAVNADRTKMQFDSRLKGIGVPNLHLKEIKETLLVKPPLSLQREFATFVHQVDKLKFDFDFLVSFSIPSICLFCLKLDP